MSNREHEATNAESLGLDHLRSFLAVMETGSQARAAKRLGIAQTTVCRHLGRHGYGFLPAPWNMASREGVVFAPIDFTATAKIAAHSLQHVTPWVTRLRDDLSAAARTALRDYRAT